MASLLKVISHIARQNTQRSFGRSLSTTKQSLKNYEGDGKTTVTILNTEYKHLVMINSFSRLGFRLNNGIFAIGPIAVFPKSVLQWNIESLEDIKPESLSLFCLLEPRLDILIIGTGDQIFRLSQESLSFLRSNKIRPEILATQEACSTFNFLNTEGRCVAAALIPPTKVDKYDEDVKLVAEVENVNSLLM